MRERRIETARTSSRVFVDFVDRKGSGILHGLAVAGGVGYHYFEVWLDGQQLPLVADEQPWDSFLSGIKGGPGHGNNGLAVELDFEHSLLVKIRSSVASPQTVFWASYTIDPTATTSDAPEAEDIDAVPHVFRETVGGRVLIGPSRWSLVELFTDFWLPGDWIAGRLEVHGDESRDGSNYDVVPLILRPSGRSRQFEPLVAVQVVRGAGSFEVPPGVLLERRDLQVLVGTAQDLELVADLAGYANFPATLR